MRDPSSLTRDWTHIPCVGRTVWITREVPQPDFSYFREKAGATPPALLYNRGNMWQRELGTLCQQDQRAGLGLLASLAGMGAQPVQALLARLSPKQIMGWPSDTNHPHWCHGHRERWRPLAKQVIISFLTSLGNSSALHEEVVDLSPILGEQNNLGWSGLSYKDGAEWEGPFLYHHLTEATCQPALLPHPEHAGPTRWVPVTHHAPLF